MEISFKDILRIIKTNIIFVIIVSMIFAGCSFFVTTFFMKKTYASSVKLYVSANYTDNSAADDLTTYNYTSKLVATYIEMLNSNKFYSAVSEELNGKYSSSQLQEMISFTSVENTEIFKAVVVSDDPMKSKEIADVIVKIAPDTISELLVNNYQLKIVDEATVPKNPTSPNLKKNVLFAFLAGFVLTLIIVFLRDYFDVKIKYDDEMTEICGVPVLSAIPDFDSFVNAKKPARLQRETEGRRVSRNG